MRARRPIALRLARVLLLLVFLGSVAGLGYLFLDQRKATAALSRSPEMEVVGLDGDGQFAVAGRGFTHEASEDGKTLFTIHGKSLRSDFDDRTLLDGVEVFMARERGGFKLKSRQASYDRSNKEARLEGDVVVEGPDRLVVYSEWLELQQGGHLLVASPGSKLELGPRIIGRAESLRIDFDQNRASLGGGVLLTTREGLDNPFGLRAERIDLLRGQQRVEARGNVELAASWGVLESAEMNLDFDASNRVRFLSAQWEVRGWFVESEVVPIAFGEVMTPSSEPLVPPIIPERADLWSRQEPDLRTELRGISLSVEIDPVSEQPRSLDLDGLYRRRPAILVAFGAGDSRRRLQAVEIQARFDAGRLSSAEALGPVRVSEMVGEEEQRVGVGDRAGLLFERGGAVGSMDLEGHVVLEEADLYAQGERAVLDGAQDRVRLSGGVTVVSPRGTLAAPLVTYDRRSGVMNASGGVRTLLDSEKGEPLGGVVFGGAQGPVRIESDEAVLQRDTGEIVFRGQVRAWQQANRLLADQLRADQDRGRLSASGEVKTVWHPSDPTSDEADGGPPTPVEIAAVLLTYDRETGELHYQQEVLVLQSGREVRCNDLNILLDEQGAAREMVCKGNVALYDPELERRVTGERATYDPEKAEIRIEGSPVELKDPQRTLRGRTLWYRLDDGRFEIE